MLLRTTNMNREMKKGYVDGLKDNYNPPLNTSIEQQASYKFGYCKGINERAGYRQSLGLAMN